MRAFFGQSAAGPFVSLSERGVILALAEGAPIDDPLALLNQSLTGIGRKSADIDEVVCDRGPGGFSSVRRRVTVAATLAQALGADVYASGPLTSEEAAALSAAEFKAGAPLEPLYDRAPNITTPKNVPHLNRSV
jgi:hypothetical protein